MCGFSCKRNGTQHSGRLKLLGLVGGSVLVAAAGAGAVAGDGVDAGPARFHGVFGGVLDGT